MKTLLGFALSGLAAVWIGCSSESSPVSPSASKALTDDDGSATTISTVTISAGIDIPDDSLRAALVLVLPTVPDASTPITQEHMESLTAFSAGGKGIKNLRGLEYATNLKSLYLKVNDVADLTPLANLTKLEVLNLENNLIPQTGYSPLANLTKLTSLRIGGHRNADIGSDTLEVVVENMTNLTDLKVNHMGLTDIDFLEDLPKLRYLNLNGNREITNLKPLACLPNLSDLRVERVGNAYNTVTGELHPLILFLIGEGVYVDYIT